MMKKTFSVTMDTPGLLDKITERLAPPRPDCLIWPGAVDRGYGRVWVDGKAKRVHRVVWELTHGPIPEGLTVDHLCRIRACCNTEHMELVSIEENLERAKPYRMPPLWKKSRSRPPRERPRKTSLIRGVQCKKGHPYTEGSFSIEPGGTRRCLICRKASRSARTERDRAKRAA